MESTTFYFFYKKTKGGCFVEKFILIRPKLKSLQNAVNCNSPKNLHLLPFLILVVSSLLEDNPIQLISLSPE